MAKKPKAPEIVAVPPATEPVITSPEPEVAAPEIVVVEPVTTPEIKAVPDPEPELVEDTFPAASSTTFAYTLDSWFELHAAFVQSNDLVPIVHQFCIDFDLPLYNKTDIVRVAVDGNARRACKFLLAQKR